MKRSRRKLLAAVGSLAIIGSAAAGSVAFATANNDGDDVPLTGSTYDRAVEAALASTNGGTVTETEIGDDGAAYEVEIRLENGKQIEVHLDENFTVIGNEPDDDGAGDNDNDD